MLNRWQVYEMLKGNRKMDKSEIEKSLTEANPKEIREGVIEYLLSDNSEKSYMRGKRYENK